MDRSQWNKLVLDHAPPFGAFLQSWEWGEFQRILGREVERVDHISGKGRVIVQSIKLSLPMGQDYWFMPKGPLGTASLNKKIDILRDHFDGAMFLRMEPGVDTRLLRVKDVQPSATLVLNLRQSVEEILAGCKSKTRYNIRLARKKGVEVRKVDLSHFDDFVRLLEQTTTRDRFFGHPIIYYKTMLEVLSGKGAQAFLAMAFFEGRPLAGNIMIDFGDTRTYLHGASSNLHRNVMAPYALHMWLIEDAKKQGLSFFDFWGIAPPGAEEGHQLAGVTRYKKGFGGEVNQMPGTFDLPMKHIWYSGYRAMKRVRRKKK